MKYAIISGGVVENIILWDSSNDPSYSPSGQPIGIEDSSNVSIGWFYDGSVFIDPSEPTQVPE